MKSPVEKIEGSGAVFNTKVEDRTKLFADSKTLEEVLIFTLKRV